MKIKALLEAQPSHTLKSSGIWETIQTRTVLEFIAAWGAVEALNEDWGVETLTIERGSIRIIFLILGEEFQMECTYQHEPISFVEAEVVLGAELFAERQAIPGYCPTTEVFLRDPQPRTGSAPVPPTSLN